MLWCICKVKASELLRKRYFFYDLLLLLFESQLSWAIVNVFNLENKFMYFYRHDDMKDLLAYVSKLNTFICFSEKIEF